MRIQSTAIALLLVAVCCGAEEIIPGVVSFTPPAGFQSIEAAGDAGGPSDYSVGKLREYLSQDGRQININARLVGSSFGNGKRVNNRQLDDAGVKKQMLDFFKAAPNPPGITNLSQIVETKLGGQKAFSVTFHSVVRDYGIHIYGDLYWVRVDTNRVVEVELSTSTAGSGKREAWAQNALVELRKSLSGFTIKKSYSK